jgi:hypothetical protein
VSAAWNTGSSEANRPLTGPYGSGSTSRQATPSANIRATADVMTTAYEDVPFNELSTIPPRPRASWTLSAHYSCGDATQGTSAPCSFHDALVHLAEGQPWLPNPA